MTDFEHGATTNGYSNRGCRCRPCREAHSAWTRDRRARRQLEIAEDSAVAEHGTESTYTNWGCRCDQCREAHNAYARDLRRRRAVDHG